VKYGIAIRNMGPQSTRATIRACAAAAEALGYDALFVSDHLCIPPDQTEGSGGRYLDVLTTLAYQRAGEPPRYALEGSIAITGALVQWLRDNLKLLKAAPEVEELAKSVDDNGGLSIVPAFSGLFAPYW